MDDSAKKYEWCNQIVGDKFGGLWVGGAPFYRGESNYNISKFRTVVLCADDAQYIGQDYLFAARRDRALFRCPLEDSSRPFTNAETKAVVATVKAIVDRAIDGVFCQHVLVTCQAGINRSALVAALALLGVYTTTPEGVIELIRERRQLDFGEALCNESFVTYIQTWRKR